MSFMLPRLQSTKARAAAAPVAELRLFRTHNAALGHVRRYPSAPYEPVCIVETQNDDAMVCGSIIEEIRPRNPRQCRHRVFSVDLKTAAIARVLEDRRTFPEVAASMELSVASLRRWVARAQTIPSRTAGAAEPSTWLVLPLPIDCNGAEPAEPAEPQAPPEEAPPPPEEAPPLQEFPPNTEPDIEPPAPPEESPPPQECPPPGSYA